MAKALEACEENGWEALRLTPKELTRLFPDLWEAKNAREALGGEEPREAYKDIIRVWGLLNAPPQPTMLGNWPMA